MNADGRTLPDGTCVDTALWLRVRARLLDTLEKVWPDVTDGNLADVTDAACVGFVEQSREFKVFSRWYARHVDRLVAHTATLEAALALYADPETWGEDDWGIKAVNHAEYGVSGAVARAALAAVGGEQAEPAETT